MALHSLYGKEVEMAKPVRLGLIGCGGIVQKAHAGAYLAIPESVQIMALADVAEDNLEVVGGLLTCRPSGVFPIIVRCWKRRN